MTAMILPGVTPGLFKHLELHNLML